MKYLKQVVILLLITFLSEVLRTVIPLTIPAGIYGMILLFTALVLGIVKLEHVKDVGKFLIEIMPIMFIRQRWVLWIRVNCSNPCGCNWA